MQLLTKTDTREKIFVLLKASLPVLIGAFIFFRPIPHVTALEEIAFYSAAVIAISLILLRKMEFSLNSPLTFPFVAFGAWALLGSFFAINKENSLHDLYAHLLKYLVFYYIVINVFNTKKRLLLLSWIIVLSAVILSYGGIIYIYVVQGYPFTERLVNPIYFPYREFVYVFASLLALNILSTKTTPVSAIVLIVCLVGTVGATLLTQNRGALLALPFAALILFLINKRELLGLFAIVVILIILMSPFYSRVKVMIPQRGERIETQFLYMEVIKEHPMMGIGFGMQTYTDDRLMLDQYLSKVDVRYRQKYVIRTPHNTFTDIGVRTGLVGMGLYLWILFTLCRMTVITIRHGKDEFSKKWGLCILVTFIAFIIQGMLHDTAYGVQAIVQYLIFAMATVLWKLTTEPESQKEVRVQ